MRSEHWVQKQAGDQQYHKTDQRWTIVVHGGGDRVRSSGALSVDGARINELQPCSRLFIPSVSVHMTSNRKVGGQSMDNGIVVVALAGGLTF